MGISPNHKLAAVFLGVGIAFLGNAALACGAADAVSRIPLKGFVREVENSYSGVRALRAHFIQTYTSGESERTESGTVLFARGGRMRWDYLHPQPKLFLSDGKHVTLYDPAEKQLDRSSVKKSEDYRVPFRLLLTRLHLRKYFSRIQDAGDALPHPAQDRVLRGIPKGGDRGGYRQVLMEFNPHLDLNRLVITYTDGSRMDFRFDRIERNPPFDSDAFVFHPPAGTEIIEQ
jgi:outer membrane lipoprotein carrier protein